ncbi:MAG: ligand-gated channel protein, partial [Dysgonomonas sp.]
STSYKIRIPTIPYFFFNTDLGVNWNNAFRKGNVLNLTYYSNYVKEFPLRYENQGSSGKSVVPSQFSHDVSLSYVMLGGKYNIALECRNLTDEKLYDNFSLQKPGRAFYAKLRYFFSK